MLQEDKELYEAIFKEKAPDDEKFVMKAIGKAMAQAMADKELEELEDLIELPSKETVDEWIRLAEERIEERKKVSAIYEGGHPWKYYLTDPFGVEDIETTEKEFLEVVGTDRGLVPMKYAEDNVNRQNFFLDDLMIGYRVRQRK